MLWDDYHGYGIGESFGYYFGNLQYFVRPIKGINLLLTSFIYTIDSCGSMFVEGKTYNRYHGVQPLFAQCDSTGCTKIRIEKDWFINEETKIVDSMCLIAYPTEQEDWQQYVSVRNVDYSDKQRYIDSVFEIGHQRYEKYDKCNRNKDRLSRGYSENKEYNAAVLDYPMMDIDGNATTIAEHEGWLLLKYWSFACPSCIVDLKRIGREKDTVGSCMIEREGIEVLAINYASDNLELLQTFASKTHTGDIVYSAKGIGNHIDMGRYLGAIQLLSPDKQFVYRAAAVDDYTEILKAKSDYEKQHPNLLK